MLRRIPSRGALAAALILTTACGDAADPTAPGGPELAAAGQRVTLPTGRGIGTKSYSIGPRTRYRAELHKGVVMTGTVRVYFILYGSWSDPAGTPREGQVLTDFAASLSGSPWLRIATVYPDATGYPPSGSLMWGRNVIDSSYSRGATLTQADVEAIVTGKFSTGELPLDSNGLFVVVGSPDVTVAGLGQTFCAFRGVTTAPAPYQIRTAYAFLGHPSRNPAECAPQLAGPSGDWASDALVFLLATELFNTIVDPDMWSGWFDKIGLEPGDKCAWDFGPTYQAPNGALANVNLGGRDYLVPRLWIPGKNGGYCAMSPP